MFLNSANVVDYGGRSYSRYRGDFHLPVEEEDANLTLVHSLGHVFPAHKPQAAKRFFNRSRQQHKLDRIMHNGDTNIKKTQQVLSAVQNNNTHTRSASPQSIKSPSSRNGFRAPKPKHSNANLNVSLIPATWDNIFAANKLLRRANKNGVSIAPQKLVQQKLVPLQTAANYKNIDIATADQDGSHAHSQSVFGLVPDSPARLKKNREASQKTFYQSASQLVNLHIDDLISEPGIQRQPRQQQQQGQMADPDNDSLQQRSGSQHSNIGYDIDQSGSEKFGSPKIHVRLPRQKIVKEDEDESEYEILYSQIRDYDESKLDHPDSEIQQGGLSKSFEDVLNINHQISTNVSTNDITETSEPKESKTDSTTVERPLFSISPEQQMEPTTDVRAQAGRSRGMEAADGGGGSNPNQVVPILVSLENKLRELAQETTSHPPLQSPKPLLKKLNFDPKPKTVGHHNTSVTLPPKLSPRQQADLQVADMQPESRSLFTKFCSFDPRQQLEDCIPTTHTRQQHHAGGGGILTRMQRAKTSHSVRTGRAFPAINGHNNNNKNDESEMSIDNNVNCRVETRPHTSHDSVSIRTRTAASPDRVSHSLSFPSRNSRPGSIPPSFAFANPVFDRERSSIIRKGFRSDELNGNLIDHHCDATMTDIQTYYAERVKMGWQIPPKGVWLSKQHKQK